MCGGSRPLFYWIQQSLLGDSSQVVVSQQSRHSMWMDIQSSYNNNNSDDDWTITLKRGLQYGVVVPTQKDEQAGTTTSVPLSKLLPFKESSFRDCCTTALSSHNNKKKKTTLHVLLSRKEKDESTVAHDDWNMDTAIEIMNLPKPSSSSLAHDAQNQRHQQQLSANRILLRPNGVANSGGTVTRIQSSLECPMTVQVVEILPPFIMPLWDTWSDAN